MAEVALEGVGKVFTDGTEALRGVDLAVADGELVVLVGPSGCGKSTALRLIAGLEAPTAGTVRIGGEAVNEQGPQARNAAMVFQSYALYPHMTVGGNLAFPLRMRRLPRAEVRRRVADTAGLLGLEDLLERRPRELSGGQRQRVAMGRALVREPSVFLMDEPLSNLDAKLRVRIRSEIARLQRRLAATTVYVTHDQAEAMTLGDRVAVLRDGRLLQTDTPDRLYADPADAFVAGFLGSPGMNLFSTRLFLDAGDWRLAFGKRALPVPESVVPASLGSGGAVFAGLRPEAFGPADAFVAGFLGSPGMNLFSTRLSRDAGDWRLAFGERTLPVPESVVPASLGSGGAVFAGLRPEAFGPAEDAPPERRVELTVQVREFLGHETLAYLEPPVPTLDPEAVGRQGTEAPGPALVARLSGDVPVPEGTALALGVDTGALRLFGPDGRRLA